MQSQDRITVDTLVRAAEALNYPTSDCFAASLWRLSCNGSVPYDVGAQLMRDCGYIPFSGFPLARSGKFRTMTREEVQTELDRNPLCSMTEETVLLVV